MQVAALTADVRQKPRDCAAGNAHRIARKKHAKRISDAMPPGFARDAAKRPSFLIASCAPIVRGATPSASSALVRDNALHVMG